MIRIKKKLSSRVIAFVTAAVFIICAVPDELFKREAARAAGSSAENTGVSHYPENNGANSGLETSDITHKDKLVDNGNGTFTFSSEISASFSHSDESKNRARTQDGYRVIDREGTYLLELWGGDGGKGSRIPVFSEDPGEPGKGGFVYGTFNSAGCVGKLLYYEVGSNGKSITRNIDDGGSGGIGGGAGNITLVSVGAGGGYSAIYLIDKEDLDKNGVIKEEAKNDPDKVLMIAGGGGGGGAGANVLPRPVNKPNGGDGGTIDTLTAVASVTNSAGKIFSGEYYAGKDGTSSGKKTKYTGKGGTDRPGDVNESVLGWFDASSFPNDWLSEYHKECARGAGGAGNLRGGGGGAGFAGGSGGVQLTAIDAENVGGGGGGSSYINTNPGKIAKWNKDNDGDNTVNNYFTDENSNTAGGSVIIRYIPTGTNSYEYLKNEVTVSGTVSEYFDIVDSESREFSITDSISPEFENKLTLGEVRDTIKLSLTLKPNAEFAGGNDVPIFSSDIVCSSSDTVKSTLINKASDYKENYSVTHVNVPFNYSIKTKSIIKKAGEDYYENELLEVVQDSYKKNNFIEKIAPPAFSDFKADTRVGNHTYTARLSIEPKTDGKNSVGTPNRKPTVLSANAVVQVYDEVPQELDGLFINSKKNISYDDGEYKLSVDVKISPKGTLREAYAVDAQDKKEELPIQINQKSYEYKPWAPGELTDDSKKTMKNDTKVLSNLTPGYYYFEAAGGDGGCGADYSKIKGANGGKGGLIKGVIYLKSSDTIKVSIGFNGADSKDNGGVLQSNNIGGYGGGSTTISVGNRIIVAAGGGGGGGKGHDKSKSNVPGDDGNGAAGLSPENPQKYSDSEQIPSDIPVKGNDSGNSDTVAATSQSAAPNCIDTSYVKFDVPEGIYLPDDYKNKLTNPNDSNTQFFKGDDTGTGGYVKIVRLAVEGSYAFFDGSVAGNITGKSTTDDINTRAQNYVSNFTLSEEFSKYFSYLDAIEVSGDGLKTYSCTKSGNKIEFEFDLPYEMTDDENWNPVADDNNITTTKHTYKLRDSYEFNITVRLKPKEGFLGGNDVPLLSKDKNITIKHSSNTADETDDVIELPKNDVTDWANVELDMSGFEFAMEDTVVPVGSVVSAADMVSITNNPAEPASWESDFVKFSSDISPADGNKIYKDTKFTLTAGLVPKAEAKKAQVIASVSGKQRSADVTAYVNCTVNYKLVNLVTDRYTDENNHEVFLLSEFSDEEYIAEITPLPGYRLPKTASVQGIDAGAYEVKNEGGKIKVIIPKEKITGNITISASGVLIPHKVHYLYQRSIFNEDGTFKEFEVVEEIDNRDYYKSVEVYNYSKVIEGSGNKPFGDTPPGYSDYEWIWPEAEYDESGNRVSGGKLKDSDTVVMGDEDLYVVGRFKQKLYRIRIKYNDWEKKSSIIGGTTPHSYEVEFPEKLDKNNSNAYTYESSFYIESPKSNVDGYFPNNPVVSGLIKDYDKDAKYDLTDKMWKILISVDYSQKIEEKIGNENALVISFYKCDSSGANPILSSQLDLTDKLIYNNSKATYDESSCKNGNVIFDEYQIFRIEKKSNKSKSSKLDPESVQNVQGEISQYKWGATNTNTRVYYSVYFKPIEKTSKTVPLKFDANSGTYSPAEQRTVKVGEEFGYEPATDKYLSLPKAANKDMIFDGWWTVTSNDGYGRLVEEDTIVEESDIITVENLDTVALRAKWKSSDVTIKIHYDYADGVPDDSKTLQFPEDKIFTVTYNKGYEFSGAEYIPQYEGFAPNMNVVKGVAVKNETINVLYSNEIKLFIKIYSSDYEYEYNLSKMPLLREAKFSVVRADNNSTVAEDVGAGGEIYLNSKSYNELTKGSTYIIRCTSPPAGFNTYEETFTLEDIVTEKTIFLKPSFELPFTGTVNQIIYYCTGAGIMLLAALLLYKTLKKEKTYDKN